MNRFYIKPCTEVLELRSEDMIAASVFSEGLDPGIPFGGVDIEGELDPESRIPMGNFIFGE